MFGSLELDTLFPEQHDSTYTLELLVKSVTVYSLHAQPVSGDIDGVGVLVGVTDGVGVLVGVTDGVSVIDGVIDGVTDGVMDGVTDDVLVTLGVGDGGKHPEPQEVPVVITPCVPNLSVTVF